MHRSKQSKTEKDRQNKTKQILNELIEEYYQIKTIILTFRVVCNFTLAS